MRPLVFVDWLNVREKIMVTDKKQSGSKENVTQRGSSVRIISVGTDSGIKTVHVDKSVLVAWCLRLGS